MMPQEGWSRYDESFTSFLAGVLYTRRTITNFDFFELMNEFEKCYNVTIYSGDDIKIPIYLEDKGIRLQRDYSDIVVIDNNRITVKEYLYSLMTPNVQDFFRIPDVKQIQVKVGSPFVKRILKRKIAI